MFKDPKSRKSFKSCPRVGGIFEWRLTLWLI